MNVVLLVLLTMAAPSATVTMPLADAMPLMYPAAKEEQAVRPPVEVLLVHQTLKGKPQQDGLIIDGNFVVEVLADKTWSQLVLLPLGPDVVVQQLESPEGATLAPRGGQLVFLSARAGRYVFNVRLLVRAHIDGAARSAILGAPVSSGLVPLALEADPGIFELQGADEVFPVEGRYTVKWRARTHVAPVEKREPPPPLEPKIKQLSATWVTTLEGRVTARLTYRLLLDRPQPLEVTVPEGQQLESVRVNGQVQTGVAKGGVLKLPQRCSALEGCRCTVYEQRPFVCRRFDCLLVRSVTDKELPLNEAQGIVEEARARLNRLEGLLPRRKPSEPSGAVLRAATLAQGGTRVSDAARGAFDEAQDYLRRNFVPD